MLNNKDWGLKVEEQKLEYKSWKTKFEAISWKTKVEEKG